MVRIAGMNQHRLRRRRVASDCIFQEYFSARGGGDKIDQIDTRKDFAFMVSFGFQPSRWRECGKFWQGEQGPTETERHKIKASADSG